MQSDTRHWSLAARIASSILFIMLAGCASFSQKDNEMWTRVAGTRTLASPQPITVTAPGHWEYAWLSEAAYQDSVEKGKDGIPLPECSNPPTVLEAAGWQKLETFPSAPISDALTASHLRIEAWYHPQKKQVVVAFGGTVFYSGKDWRANLRWFLPKDKNDEYSVLVRTAMPDFAVQYNAKMHEPGFEWMEDATLITTGHSLGGGLAQQFAYALAPKNGLPRVSKVYAFDTSPVTGYFSVDQDLRNANSKKLEIERIYERSEILAGLRSVLAQIYPPSVSDPQIIDERYQLFWSWRDMTLVGAVGQHSIVQMATALSIAAGRGYLTKDCGINKAQFMSTLQTR